MPSPTPAIRVGIDVRCLNTTHIRGMGKYVQELLSHTTPSDIRWHFFTDRPELELRLPGGVYGNAESFDLRGYRFHTWEQIGLPWHARQSGVEVLHCTASTLPLWQPVPTVVTLHDTIPWENAEMRQGDGWYLDHLIPGALKRCAAIITISESSRQDIMRLWPILEQKVRVIPHGIGDRYLAARNSQTSPRLRETVGTAPYLLYIGGPVERKRFAWACEVLERMEFPGLQLIACGFGDQDRQTATGKLKPELRHRVRILPFVHEEEMPGLYRNAVAVLYPTLYEGFGLPALEAQAVGTPVLFSELGSLGELRGPAAEVLPPYDLDAWVSTCRRFLDQRAAAGSIQNEAARVWAKQFSWEASAAKHHEVYKMAARGRSAQRKNS